MKAHQAVHIAHQREQIHAAPTMVYYDDDYQTYRVIDVQDYYQIPTVEQAAVVWSSDEGWLWTRHQLTRHPA